ncbi:unnamed protein product [Allacma fusca]|uniref:DUF7920 domain-containing protein n=1 Tax=Allacma fusca TaxID=39272 RepID=A0A8J2JX64_9HEXA|nr:unnamed protein product [Allacma fusca]
MDCYKEESETAQKWVKWCHSRNLTKCVEFQVPDGILPYKFKGILIDVKVHGTKKFSGPDDRIYSENEDLRKNVVARGNCVLELEYPLESDAGDSNSNSNKKREAIYIFLVFALRKFSGGLGDEDDSQLQNMWQKYFIKPVESADRIVCTTKANGEAAHVSCCLIKGEYYMCFGSKNVHLLVKNKDDLLKYKDSRFEFARRVGQSFFSHSVELMGPEKFQELKEYLTRTRYTMICELLQPENQHVVNLSHLEQPELQFICWAEQFQNNECSSLCAMPPDEAIEIARSYNLQTVEYQVIPPEEAELEMAKIRSESGYEGKVLYFLDGHKNVIGLIKKKTSWYIILRAIREKAAHFTSSKNAKSVGETQKQVTKRIKDIQGWVGFSDEYRQKWNELGQGFIKWVQSKKSAGDLRAKFPPLWQQFLDSSEQHKSIYENLQYS